ncbi:MAG: ATP-binding protein [Aquabacterium sp.]
MTLAPGPAAGTPPPAGRQRHRPHGHRSLSLRLLALFLLLALAIGAVVMGGMERLLRFGYGGVVQPLLSDYVDRLTAEIGTPPDVARARAIEQRLPVRIYIDGPTVRHGEPPYGHDRRRGDRPKARAADDDADEANKADGMVSRRTTDGHRIRFSLAPQVWHDRPRAMGWWMLGLLLLATLLVFHAVRRLFRPIDDIRAGALRYGQGDFTQPIPVRRRDELGELAGQVNTMARELQRMLEAKRELLLAISHELRSPLTRARLNAELLGEAATAGADALSGGHGRGDAADANPAHTRDALLHDLQEMKLLIEQLLEHERLAGGHHALHREPCDVASLVRSVLHDHFAGAAIDLQITGDAGTLALDRARVAMALRNLVANALRHGGAPDGRPPQLQVRRDGGQLVVRVRDFGPGVAQEHLVRLSEAFYRPDTARGRDSGGVGLGLALCRMVAQAHGGTLELAHAQPGLAATLVLPAGPISPLSPGAAP